jgi:hypothetical protein
MIPIIKVTTRRTTGQTHHAVPSSIGTGDSAVTSLAHATAGSTARIHPVSDILPSFSSIFCNIEFLLLITVWITSYLPPVPGMFRQCIFGAPLLLVNSTVMN